MTTERDILHEVGGFYVARNRRCNALVVYRPTATHAESDSAYCDTPEGLTLAKARCDYLARRAVA